MDYQEFSCIRHELPGNPYISPGLLINRVYKPFLLPGIPVYKPWITGKYRV